MKTYQDDPQKRKTADYAVVLIAWLVALTLVYIVVVKIKLLTH